MKKWGDGDDPGEPKTAMDMVATLSSLNAEVLRRIHKNEFYDGVISRAADVVRALSAIPSDAAERLADAEQRVEKMRHALNLVRCGTDYMIREQRESIQKAIDEALE